MISDDKTQLWPWQWLSKVGEKLRQLESRKSNVYENKMPCKGAMYSLKSL